MEEPPGHGSHLVEEVQRLGCLTGVDASGGTQQAEGGPDFQGRAVPDPPVMMAIPATAAVTLGEIRTQDERFSATICTNLLRPGRL